MGADIKTDWPTDRRSKIDFNLKLKNFCEELTVPLQFNPRELFHGGKGQLENLLTDLRMLRVFTSKTIYINRRLIFKIEEQLKVFF
jgi:hypothetical protein